MPDYMLFRTDKIYVTDGTLAGTKAIGENSRYVGTRTDTDITQTDGRLTFYRGVDGVKAMDTLTGAIYSVPGFNTGNFWPGFTASLPDNTFILKSPGILASYAPDQTPVQISNTLGAHYDIELVSFAGQVFFAGSDSFGSFIGSSDGTATGTGKFYSRNDQGATFNRLQLDEDWIINGRMLFAANAPFGSGRGLYATDGTSAGTVSLAEDLGHSQSDLIRLGNRFLFSTTDSDVWSTDGTQAGTFKVAEAHSLLDAAAAGLGITPAEGFPHRLISEISVPFVVGSRAYVTVKLSLYDAIEGSNPSEQDFMVLFDVTGRTPVMSRSFDGDFELINNGGGGKGYLFSGEDQPRPAISASGVMFFYKPYSRDDQVYAADLNGGEPVPVYRYPRADENFGAQFDLGSHMIFRVGSGSLISVDLSTLQTTFIARDIVGIDDLRLSGDKLYWKDGRGVHVTDGTTAGTLTLSTTATGIESSVIGIMPLADGLFERMATMGDDHIDLRSSTRNERVEGGAGDDWIRTGRGNDTIDGGLGEDRMEGGAGNDVYYVDNAGDRVIETQNGGSDRVFSSVSWTLPTHVEALFLTGIQPINGTGNSGNNTITGNSGANILRGGAGNDRLDGGAGADRMEGGIGDDTYIVDNLRDVIVEGRNAGLDTVRSSVNWTLGANLENLTLTGTAISGTGNAAANRIIGNAESNVLSGLGGNDLLNGGHGHDRLYGGSGADRLLGGGGRDSLYGGAGNDVLDGGVGNDWLDGGAGIDRMIGGAGNDTYIVDNIRDLVVEAANAGIDTVRASVSYSLAGTHAENLVLTGAGNVNATGNSLANTIIGNAGNNRLAGGAGADRLTGGAGRDVFVFQSIGDSTPRPAGRDTITDFRPAQGDRIHLAAIDADTTLAGNQAFSFIGGRSFSGQAGELSARSTASGTLVSADVNGDRIADFAVLLSGNVALTADQFLL